MTGSHAGVIVLKESFIPLWSTTLPRESSLIVCKKAVEKMEGQRFTLDPGATCGPYRIKKWEPRLSITLERNPLWPGPKAPFDEIQGLAILDANAAEIAYEAGQIDATHVPMTSVPRLQAKLPANSALVTRPGLTYWWLGMQMESGIFTDARVRKAVQLAVDVKSVLDGAFFGVPAPSTGIIAPGLIGHRDKNLIAGPNLEQARKLLAEAGYPDGFTTDLWAMPVQRPYNPNARRIAELMQADLAKIGVKAEIKSFEWGEYRKRVQDGEHQMAQFGWTGDTGDPDNVLNSLLGCDAAKPGGGNIAKFCYRPFEELVAKAKTVSDQAQRTELYRKAQVIFKEQAPWFTIAHAVQLAPVRKEVIDFKLSPFGRHTFYGVDIKS